MSELVLSDISFSADYEGPNFEIPRSGMIDNIWQSPQNWKPNPFLNMAAIAEILIESNLSSSRLASYIKLHPRCFQLLLLLANHHSAQTASLRWVCHSNPVTVPYHAHFSPTSTL